MICLRPIGLRGHCLAEIQPEDSQMCGICGLACADAAQSVDPAMLERMTDIVRYRGPDSDGFYRAPGIGLGVRRLAINDLQTGDQPISNEDATVTVVCNGEIYNFPELRSQLKAAGHRFRTRSDVEVIVHLYEDQGVGCLQHLRGMFAFALWDTRRRRLMLARDRLGIKPLHYALGKHGCLFGSELKSILIADQVERRMDIRALKDAFELGFVAAPKTFFTDIRRLSPGHYLLYQDGCASIHRYWDVVFPRRGEEDRSRTAQAWADSLLDKLQESVRIHLRSDVPLGAWLSPGVDSSSVVALMRHLVPQPIETFTLAFENPDFDETRKSATLDRYPGYTLSNRQAVCTGGDFDLFPKALWHCEDAPVRGMFDRLLISELASSRVKVAMTGEGSDELFGGYAYFKFGQLLRPLAHLPLSLRRLALLGPLLPKRWPWASRMLLAPACIGRERYRLSVAAPGAGPRPCLFSPELTEMLAEVGDEDGEISRPADFESWHPFSQLQYYEMKLRMPEFVIHTLDRASMAYSLEARVPFLDHELVELSAQIPPSLKVRGLREKWILRRAMRGYLPEDIVKRPKRGLRAPVAEWLRGELPEFATEMLSEDDLRKKGYFNPDTVIRLLGRHRAGDGSYDSPLLAVLSIQLWDDLFLHGCRPP